MKERMKFVLAWEEGAESVAALCRRFGISRKTGYKWLMRSADGVEALANRSSRPGSTTLAASG